MKEVKQTDSEVRLDVSVVFQERGMQYVCKSCEKPLSKGYYGIGLVATYLDKHQEHFMLGVTPAPTCCGKIRNVFLFLDSEAEAEKKAQETKDQIAKNGNTVGLKILSYDERAIIPNSSPERN